MRRRWLFADQLGPYFLDSADQRVLLIEARRVFRRRRFHRQKAHLILSALRHRAAELGPDQCDYRQADTYRDVLQGYGEPLDVIQPTSWAAVHFVDRMAETMDLDRLPARGYATSRADFARWAEGRDRRRLLMEDFYRNARERLDVLMAKGEPVTGQWNYDADNREPPPKRRETLGVPDPWWPEEDEIDAQVRADLDAWAAEGMEFAAEDAYAEGHAPISAVEGFVRQIIGWRDYIWNLYWYFGEDYRSRNELQARTPLPTWFVELDPEGTQANCLRSVLTSVRDHGWAHHIPRLMVLGNYGLQRGFDPAELTDWFHRSFVDGYDWVMVPNVVGMSQHADGGELATKPYAGGGNYINKMSDYCGPCVYDPKVRVGPDACPFTAGYWLFLNRHRETFAQNHRMFQMIRGLDRLSDLDALVEQGPKG